MSTDYILAFDLCISLARVAVPSAFARWRKAFVDVTRLTISRRLDGLFTHFAIDGFGYGPTLRFEAEPVHITAQASARKRTRTCREGMDFHCIKIG